MSILKTEIINIPTPEFEPWIDPQPPLSPSAKLKLMSCFEKMRLGWKTGSLYEKMGIIPIVSNIKGIIDIVPSILKTCTWFVCSVALGALFLVSCCFSQCNKNLSSIRNNLTLSDISKNTLSETLLGLTVVSGQYSLQNLTSASMYKGLIQQIPVFGNLKYAEALALQALQKAEIAQPPAMLPEEGANNSPFPGFDPFLDYHNQGCDSAVPKKPAKGGAVPSRRGSIIGFRPSSPRHYLSIPQAAGAASGIATARTPDLRRDSLSSLTLTPDYGVASARSRASTFDDSAASTLSDGASAKLVHTALDARVAADDLPSPCLSIVPYTGRATQGAASSTCGTISTETPLSTRIEGSWGAIAAFKEIVGIQPAKASFSAGAASRGSSSSRFHEVVPNIRAEYKLLRKVMAASRDLPLTSLAIVPYTGGSIEGPRAASSVSCSGFEEMRTALARFKENIRK